MGKTAKRLRTILAALLLAAVAAASAPGNAAAAEVIRSFDSQVEILSDGSLVVRETIIVRAEGNRIRRGIFRDLPFRSPGSRTKTSYRVRFVSIDGNSSAGFQVEDIPGGVRVRMGSSEITLAPGDHTFVLEYATSGHLRFFEEGDEFGWNVTGDKWEFIIEKATCSVRVPGGGDVLEMTGWMGRKGSRDPSVACFKPEPGVAHFTARKAIGPGEHFNVAVRFPGGIVPDPGQGQTVRAIVVLVLTLLFYLVTWWCWGKDPKPGTIIPLFYPPEAGFYGRRKPEIGATTGVMSAAAASYVKKAAFLDTRAFSSLFLSLASHGLCTIRGTGADFSITPRAADRSVVDRLPREERSVYDSLVSAVGIDHMFSVSNENARSIVSMHMQVVSILSGRYASLWAHNLWIQALGWLVVLPAGVLALNNAGDSFFQALLPPAVFAVIIFFIRKQVAYFWSRSINSANPAKTLAYFLIISVAIAWRIRAFSLLVTAGSLLYYQIFSLNVISIVLVALPMLFCPTMKAPSRTCRALMDKIDGLLMYINTAERDRLMALNPPEDSPRTFERLLPYAAAFGLEETWCARFASIMAVGERPENDAGDTWTNDWSPMIRQPYQVNSFSDSLTRSAVPPSSNDGGSSDSGGSFFSDSGGGAGSGGGGGGGGGW